MRILSFSLPVICALIMLGCAVEEEKEVEIKIGQHAMSFDKTVVVTKDYSAKYLLHLPEGYDKNDQQWPLIVFLHGAGERGDDLNKVKYHGPPKIVEKKKDFPFVVLSPQCPAQGWWDEDLLINLIDETIDTYKIDKSRVYMTGLSMGGFGTWKLACKYPDRFAAIAPICGGGEPYDAMRKLRDMPMWVFHGAKDNIVPLKRSEEMVDAIKKAGGTPKFTVYPEANHDSWTATYDNPELYEWFLKQINTRVVK